MVRKEVIVVGGHYFAGHQKARAIFGGLNSSMTEIKGIFYGNSHTDNQVTSTTTSQEISDQLFNNMPIEKNYGVFIARKEPGNKDSFITFKFKFAQGYYYQIVIDDPEGLLLPKSL